MNQRVFVLRGEERLGPFSVEEIRSRLESGEFGVEDAAWHVGLPECSTLGNIMQSAGYFAKAPIRDTKSGIISVVFAVGACSIVLVSLIYCLLFGPKLTGELPESIFGFLLLVFMLLCVQGLIFGYKGCKAENKGWSIAGLVANGVLLLFAIGIVLLGALVSAIGKQ